VRLLSILLAASCLATGVALAQTDTTAAPATNGAANQPAAATAPDANAAAQPQAGPPQVAATALETGANSFTEDQARKRLEDAGLAEVGGLAKDDQGVWRGKAMRDGKPVSVGLDYKGNVAVE
jgi:periplasmic protein CpxP/Spy